MLHGNCYLLAEYSPGPLYMGWWLYERVHNDGSPNGDDWGWLSEGDKWSPQWKARRLCRRMGHEPPEVHPHHQHFAKWFAETFPNGLHVRATKREHRYELLEIPDSRPRRKRRAIRTIRGAAMALTVRKAREVTS